MLIKLLHTLERSCNLSTDCLSVNDYAKHNPRLYDSTKVFRSHTRSTRWSIQSVLNSYRNFSSYKIWLTIKIAAVPRTLFPNNICSKTFRSLDTFRSRRMDHTVFHKWLIEQTNHDSFKGIDKTRSPKANERRDQAILLDSRVERLHHSLPCLAAISNKETNRDSLKQRKERKSFFLFSKGILLG